MLVRCIIKFEIRNYYIAKSYMGEWYLIKKNELNKYFKRGEDYNFYCKMIKSFLIDKLIPISDEEAFAIK